MLFAYRKKDQHCNKRTTVRVDQKELKQVNLFKDIFVSLSKRYYYLPEQNYFSEVFQHGQKYLQLDFLG